MVTTLLAVLAASCGSSSGAARGPVTLNWYIFPEFSGAFVKSAQQCSAHSHGAYTIKIQTLPNAADGQRQQMVRRLAANDPSLDILGLDVTWTPEFAEAGWIEPWPQSLAQQVEKGTLKSMVNTATWNGKLYSAPFNTNTQLLWYRKDLVPHPPKTWKQMISMADALAKQGKPHYIEIQGAQYEGYTVWFNTLVASAGGQIVSADGKKVILGKPAIAALDTIHALTHSKGVDPSLGNQMEDQNRLQFEAGVAAFELNYPYVYPSAKADVPKIFKNMAWTVVSDREGRRAHARDDRRDRPGGRQVHAPQGAGLRRHPVPAKPAERDQERDARRPAARARVDLPPAVVPEGLSDVEGDLRHAEAGQRAAEDARLPERVAADLLHPLAAVVRVGE